MLGLGFIQKLSLLDKMCSSCGSNSSWSTCPGRSRRCFPTEPPRRAPKGSSGVWKGLNSQIFS